MILAASWMGAKIRVDEDKSLFLPGETTYGHHQIELACDSCHTEEFASKDAMQEACESCHLDQLKAAKDDHPKTKFTDPRNADRVALLDARYCITCHVEHRPDITSPMGLTLPTDYCFICHEDIAEDRPSHEGMAFDTCATAGCHNFHDNRALYEDFLIRHLDKADFLEQRREKKQPNLLEVAPVMGEYPLKAYPLAPLTASQADAPEQHLDSAAVSQWLASKHAEQGANCSSCHIVGEEAVWVEKPDHTACKTCHSAEVDSFLLGKHGMRLDKERLGVELSPMTPSLARLEMTEKALHADPELGCSTCHAAHDYNVETAATDGCLTCHADEHSLAFKSSPHYVAKEDITEETSWLGISCADCHMPMIDKDYYDGEITWTLANHNQSENFLPNEKMIRPVCMNCHSLGFSINAMADRDLIKSNFNGKPSVEIQGMHLVRARIELAKKAKEAAAKAAAEHANDPAPMEP